MASWEADMKTAEDKLQKRSYRQEWRKQVYELLEARKRNLGAILIEKDVVGLAALLNEKRVISNQYDIAVRNYLFHEALADWNKDTVSVFCVLYLLFASTKLGLLWTDHSNKTTWFVPLICSVVCIYLNSWTYAVATCVYILLCVVSFPPLNLFRAGRMVFFIVLQMFGCIFTGIRRADTACTL
jgi:hypothetical protein